MTPILLFPLGLAALAALAVPLAIHLARRSELARIDFAALRWLAAKPRPRTRLRFDEWPLLIARLLLFALVALWLARPTVFGSSTGGQWVAVVPGADLAAVPHDASAQRRWLAPGFPALDNKRPDGAIAVASLLRQLDAELPPGASLRVVVPAQITGADAERPRLSRPVAWQITPGAMTAAPAPAGTLPPVLSVRYPPERRDALRYLRAAVIGWTAPGRAPVFDAEPPSAPLPPYPANLVWLAPGDLPAAVHDWVAGGGTALLAADAGPVAAHVVWRDAVGAALATAEPLGRGRIIRLTRPLDPAAMPQLLEPDFPERLRALFDAPRPAPARVAAIDYAPLTGGAIYPPPARDLQPWLALVIAAIFVIERWLATGRRRGTA
ncbi:BatA domain-containing protein [Polymorphobacter sp. PAMC 29334]|uniref:BatA domain-containing protein n=1 Tax=Polymorphobacter sp. PAMC 29334 TaxID=2862331 RepID=UPI001C750F27|nr:BatA domain-containing protein [Polymorphobacter sp. PAMC 29334]QYE35483.1 BatA domain-containing protein [Polymorphobacter sp. PAMC 29334]